METITGAIGARSPPTHPSITAIPTRHRSVIEIAAAMTEAITARLDRSASISGVMDR